MEGSGHLGISANTWWARELLPHRSACETTNVRNVRVRGHLGNSTNGWLVGGREMLDGFISLSPSLSLLPMEDERLGIEGLGFGVLCLSVFYEKNVKMM